MYRNSVRAHSRRRSAFDGKTLETRTVARTVDSSLPPINRRSTVGPTLLPSAIRRLEPPEHKRRIPAVSRREVFSHPPSSYSNASARDYDEGDEAVSESSSPSTGGSTFNQIDGVEHVSPLAEESEGPTRPTTSTEDVSSSGRGKSPRVVLSKTFPQLSPRNVEQIATTIRQKGVPRELRFDRQNPAPETASRSRALPAPGEATAKISSEVYDYRIFRTPESYKSANLEPPDYGREEKYEPVPLAVPTTGGVLAEPSQGMSPDRTFIAPAAAPRPKTKVALGAKKVATKPAADPPVTNVPDVTPTDASSGGGTAPDLQVTLGPSRRGKEKLQETEVEEVLTLKRTKRPASTQSSDLHEGLRERDALASTLVNQIRDKVPGMETIMGWSCNRLGEQIAEDILRKAFVRKRASRSKSPRPRVEFGSWRRSSQSPRIEPRRPRGNSARAEKAEKEAIDKMKDASSLARFICSDEAVAKEFLTVFINTEVGDKLTWVYGQWAFSSGCRAIEEQVHTALAEGLEESDLPVVMALLPDKVANPGPRPYSKPGPSE
nr:serine/arginine repetitive matrix protein 2-like [Ipomoea batatas]